MNNIMGPTNSERIGDGTMHDYRHQCKLVTNLTLGVSMQANNMKNKQNMCRAASLLLHLFLNTNIKLQIYKYTNTQIQSMQANFEEQTKYVQSGLPPSSPLS